MHNMVHILPAQIQWNRHHQAAVMYILYFGCAAAVDVFLAVVELVAAAAIGDFFVSVLVAIPGVTVAIVVQVQLIPPDKCHSLDSHLNILEWMMRHYSQLIRKT